jgi:hypoxanthine phosphoribosyltransferase
MPIVKQKNEEIQVHDKTFTPYLRHSQIQEAVYRIANEITNDFTNYDTPPVFIAILNGSFVFAADLMRALPIDSEITFIKAKSYLGLTSTGELNTLIGLDIDLSNRAAIIIEDIVDTGNTVKQLLENLAGKVKTVKVACLLHKPDALLHKNLQIDYIGIEIPNKFVVGYGLDYNGLGRTYKDIYQLVSD